METALPASWPSTLGSDRRDKDVEALAMIDKAALSAGDSLRQAVAVPETSDAPAAESAARVVGASGSTMDEDDAAALVSAEAAPAALNTAAKQEGMAHGNVATDEIVGGIQLKEGHQESHSDSAELWRIDGTEVDLNGDYTVGSQLWYLRERALDARSSGRRVAGTPVNSKAVDASRTEGPMTHTIAGGTHTALPSADRTPTAKVGKGPGIGGAGFVFGKALRAESTATASSMAAGTVSISFVATHKLSMTKVHPAGPAEFEVSKDMLKQMSAMTYRPPVSVARYDRLSRVYIHWYNRLTYALFISMDFVAYILTAYIVMAYMVMAYILMACNRYALFIWMDFVAFILTSLCLKAVHTRTHARMHACTHA